uniref:Uncharacterized protein n=1 Tax=Meloidogyne enterolobii TaxID=390850 RepID=A0A6V7VR30_MELEN|nr:unnamed protein product [Meloidogyne enterolobii]
MNSANKVIFLGDSGVGKSTLINSLCGIQNSRPQSTLGCSIQILAHQYQAGTPNESTELLELWDIGGSNAHRHSSRVFLDGANGVVFVHDLSNSRSEKNLSLWLDLLQGSGTCSNNNSNNKNSSRISLNSPELNNRLIYTATGSERNYRIAGGAVDSLNNFVALDVERLWAVPTLVVGTFLDNCSPSRAKEQSNVSFLRQHEHISLDSRRPIQPGSTNQIVFTNFFDAIIRHSSDCLNRTGGSRKSLSGTTSPRNRRKML